jgi:radical SAM superfamily enzyme YgiQ (UPF0313 family)
MKICFIEPMGVHKGLNTGLGYLCAVIKDETKVFDFNNNSRNVEERMDAIPGYDVIGISLKSFNVTDAVAIGKRVKNKNNFLIVGGVHISIDGYNFLKDNEQFDVAVAGEGELLVNNLLSCLKSGEPKLEKIPGLLIRKDNKVISTGPAHRVNDLAALPFPSYKSFDSVEGRISNYPLVTSRGCPYSCTYCCVKKVMGRKWYANTPERIIEELEYAVKEYGITRFNIQDDDFTLDMERAKTFCTVLIDNKLNLIWSCPNGIRADRVDRELLELMKKAGCFAITVGIETGNPDEFETIQKGEKLETVTSMISLAQEVGMYVYGNFIIGLPRSTLASTRKTIEFAKNLKLDSSIFNLLVPFPGTEIYDWTNANGRWLQDWKEGFMISTNPCPVFETDDFSKEERIQAYMEANIKLRNYFAFMNEQENLLKGIFRILSVIFRYDTWGIFSHFSWLARNYWRVVDRILHKNK